ncbi:MAG TPA: hypothetical protein VFG07_03595 [Thermoplasmata archaeon]|nr:hypothetical protein [Thermoplasmata archaeon]
MSPSHPRETLSRILWPFLGLLSLEFVLGMTLNLFGPLPSGTGLQLLVAAPVLAAHVLIGVLILGIASRALWLAYRTQDPRLEAAGAASWVFGLVAFVSGMAFVFGGQSAGASYAMATGFLGQLIAVAVLLRMTSESAGRVLSLSSEATP